MTPRELSKEEVESFERYAKENEVELDGTQSQWADYTLRLIAMLRQSQAKCERLKKYLRQAIYITGKTSEPSMSGDRDSVGH